jgi:hypothetical protein
LDGCDNALPPPARDERGRLKGGKPTRYCCKAHADEASRRRRALESVGVDEPLVVLRELGGQTREVVDSALREFAEMRRRWDELDAGAVARSAADRAETASALLKVERAERAAEDAERSRAETAVVALQDQERREAAEQAAETAIKEAEQVRKAAWEQTAEHERARGQAETRAMLAEQGQRDALERLEVARRELRDVTALQQDTARRLAESLAAADRADAARVLAEARVSGAEERARLSEESSGLAEQRARRAQEETAAARAAEASARAETADAARALAAMRSAYGVVVERLSSQDREIQDLRAQLAEAREQQRLLATSLTKPVENDTKPSTPDSDGAVAIAGPDGATPIPALVDRTSAQDLA